ncbi:MAG: acyl-CoA thioesterase [Deltaproteobacteria bacterium]|nr:acyl-CoA thioesterase [Deltaproteobacteria bacterium]
MVKSEDLNHHGTLFAGKTSMWVVEAGFIAAASLTHPENIVCVNVHGLLFKRPVPNGAIIRLESKVVLAARTRLVSYVRVLDNASEQMCLDSFLSFVHVDLQGRPLPHGIILDYADAQDAELHERAKALK